MIRTINKRNINLIRLQFLKINFITFGIFDLNKIKSNRLNKTLLMLVLLINLFILTVSGSNCNVEGQFVSADDMMCEFKVNNHVLSNTEPIIITYGGLFTHATASCTITVYRITNGECKAYEYPITINHNEENTLALYKSSFNTNCNNDNSQYRIEMKCTTPEKTVFAPNQFVFFGYVCSTLTYKTWKLWNVKMKKSSSGNFNFLHMNEAAFNTALSDCSITVNWQKYGNADIEKDYYIYNFNNGTANQIGQILLQQAVSLTVTYPGIIFEDGFIFSAAKFINGGEYANGVGFTFGPIDNYLEYKKLCFVFCESELLSTNPTIAGWQRAQIALHELGHKKSLGHHTSTSNPNCIMKSVIPTQQVYLFYCDEHKCLLNINPF